MLTIYLIDRNLIEEDYLLVVTVYLKTKKSDKSNFNPELWIEITFIIIQFHEWNIKPFNSIIYDKSQNYFNWHKE